MDAEFWHNKWAKNEIGFHAAQVNGFLQAHFGDLAVPVGGRVFVPLCGKTRDMGWMIEQGVQVVGAELSEVAIVDLFADLGLEPEIADLGAVKRYSAGALCVFVGDVFDVRADMLGKVDAVYDRAALVALPEAVRDDYVAHVAEITGGAAQLVLTFEYDQAEMTGPPFSITGDMMTALFAGRYGMRMVADSAVEGGFKGRIPAREKAWILGPPAG